MVGRSEDPLNVEVPTTVQLPRRSLLVVLSTWKIMEVLEPDPNDIDPLTDLTLPTAVEMLKSPL